MVSVNVLRVQAFLQSRVMLLKGVAMSGIIYEISEVRVKVEQRPAYKAINFERISVADAFAVVTGNRP